MGGVKLERASTTSILLIACCVKIARFDDYDGAEQIQVSTILEKGIAYKILNIH